MNDDWDKKLKKLPVKLTTEPLVEVVCEIRFPHKPHAANILLSVLFSSFGNSLAVTNTHFSTLPDVVRADHNLKYQPIMFVDWEGFKIGLSDASISIHCRAPYPGWVNLKPRIVQVFDVLSSGFAHAPIERCSLKYLNIIESPVDFLEKPEKKLNIQILLDEKSYELHPFQLKLERPDATNSCTHIINVSPSVSAKIGETQSISGVLVEVDSVSKGAPSEWNKSTNDFDAFIEKLHSGNKAIFFECMTQATIEGLGPIYE